MKVIVGLGNVGGNYKKTYHNVGFNMVDAFAKHYKLEFSKKKFFGVVAEGSVNGEKVILLKPTTFMNNSGKSVFEVSKKLKIASRDILIVFDDIDLPAGEIRYRENGSGGTHNGMRDIIQKMNTQEIPRLRIGIGPKEREDLADYVLSNMNTENAEKINGVTDKAIKSMESFILGELSK